MIKFRYRFGLSIVMGVLICNMLCGCSKDVEEIDTAYIADNMEYIMNLRYNGYSNESKDKLYIMCDEDIVRKIDNRFSGTDENVFISLESELLEYENSIIEEELDDGSIIEYNPYIGKFTDSRIIDRGGERGVYIDDIELNDKGKFSTVIYGNSVSIEVSEKAILRSLIGNPEYKLSVTGYEYYDNNEMVIHLKTNIDGAFQDAYGGVEIVEISDNNGEGLLSVLDDNSGVKMTQSEYDAHKNSFYSNYNVNEIDVKIKVSGNKIVDLNIEDVIGVFGN